jgi:Zn-dependent protease
MLGWIKQSMQLSLRVGLRIVEQREPSPPMWIELPSTMPRFGSEEFRGLRVVVNARAEDLAHRSFVWVVAGFAHELAHAVLAAIGHRLQSDERAVDLTAMALGYQAFVGDAEVTRLEGLGLSVALAALLAPFGVIYWRPPRRRTLRLGYLTRREADAARWHLAQRASAPRR